MGLNPDRLTKLAAPPGGVVAVLAPPVCDDMVYPQVLGFGYSTLCTSPNGV